MAATTTPTGGTDSFSSVAASENQALAEQAQAYAQQEQMETESAMMQSHHDTMMAIIRAIAQ